jgi:hypothetical protein
MRNPEPSARRNSGDNRLEVGAIEDLSPAAPNHLMVQACAQGVVGEPFSKLAVAEHDARCLEQADLGSDDVVGERA